MADKNRGGELPYRVPAAARAGPLSPVVPVLSEELRQRMQAAVKAERAEAAAAREQDCGRGSNDRAAPARAPVEFRDQQGSGPVPEDDVTKWLGSAVKPQHAVTLEPVVRARTAVEPEPAVRPEPQKPRRRAGARLVALGLAIIVIGSLAAVAVKQFSRSPAIQAAVRAQAAAWVAGQVSPDVTVSCDTVMCAALKADGFPVAKLVVLGPASPDPVPSVLVVETGTVRELFGSSLAAGWAPAVLASFGSGPGAITVRVVAPHGAAAYQTSLNAGLADRKTSGAALLNDSRITVSATARSQLLAGQVDSRLLLALAWLARHQPIDIVRFGNLGPGASPGVPLLFADLAQSVPAAHMDPAGYVRAVWAILSRPGAPVLPARAVSGTAQGQALLRVEFTAPSPIGKFDSGSS